MAIDDQTTSETVASQIGDALTGLFGEASPSTLFSEPIQHGDDLVVTAVAWERAGGFGFGAGQGHKRRRRDWHWRGWRWRRFLPGASGGGDQR